MMSNEKWKVLRLRELTARVKAANAAGKYANELRPILIEIFRPLVGQVIFKDGGLLLKVKKLLPEFPCTPRIDVYRQIAGCPLPTYYLGWTVRANEFVLRGDLDGSGDRTGSSESYEASMYIGDTSGKTLTKLCEQASGYRTDYTVEEVIANRKAAKEAKEIYEKAASACHPFGEG